MEIIRGKIYVVDSLFEPDKMDSVQGIILEGALLLELLFQRSQKSFVLEQGCVPIMRQNVLVIEIF